ncbi:MAG: helix-turn-helix domain-containing protein, partial [Chloroflexota bacterium]|nr:helix-turn-helix domain-containing protein [Chloroflexota bacterium]
MAVVDNSALARAIGTRIRQKRLERGLSQRALARDRFTPSYISALETGAVKPSMAALSFLAERLECSINDLLGEQPRANPRTGLRLEADLRLASRSWAEASALFSDLLESTTGDNERAELLRSLSEALVRQGKSHEAIAIASEAVNLFERLLRTPDAAEARYWLAGAHYQASNS